MSPLTESTKLVLRKGWQPMDSDAATYIAAVEAADGQALEEKTKIAIDNFVLGCKADGIWTAIKASCILAGARTLNGALVPLVGAAPTNNNFASGDYDRKTGLKGNRATKTLNTGLNRTSIPQNSRHLACFVTEDTSLTTSYNAYAGNIFGDGWDFIGTNSAGDASRLVLALASGQTLPVFNGRGTGFIGGSRSLSSIITLRAKSLSVPKSDQSYAVTSGNFFVFGQDQTTNLSESRLAFYSIGESLNLALLEARVTDLINAIGAAIP